MALAKRNLKLGLKRLFVVSSACWYIATAPILWQRWAEAADARQEARRIETSATNRDGARSAFVDEIADPDAEVALQSAPRAVDSREQPPKTLPFDFFDKRQDMNGPIPPSPVPESLVASQSDASREAQVPPRSPPASPAGQMSQMRFAAWQAALESAREKPPLGLTFLVVTTPWAILTLAVAMAWVGAGFGVGLRQGLSEGSRPAGEDRLWAYKGRERGRRDE
jgi:hypothetical protein